MSSLLRVELTRLRWRRAVVLLVLAAVVVPLLIAAVTAWDTRPLSEADLASAQQQLERDTETARAEVEDCVAAPDDWGMSADDPALRQECEEMMLPQLDWYAVRQELDLRTQLDETVVAVVMVVALLMMLVGATFAGHDWTSGSMSNQLLVQPRRGRVWAAKAIAVTATAALVGAVVGAAYWTFLYGLARWRDLPASGAVVGDGYEQVLRGAVVVAGAALAGYLLTMLFRSTIATLGVLIGVALLGGMLIALLGIPTPEQWQPGANLAAIVRNGTEVYVEVPESCYSGNPGTGPGIAPGCDDIRDLSAARGLTYYGVLALATAALSLASFRRRDVP